MTKFVNTYTGAGIILVRHSTTTEPQYLLLKGRSSGVWSFSKGHPENIDNGKELCTAVRETFEETGLRVGHEYRILGNSMRFGKRHYWIGILTNPFAYITLCGREHSTYTWSTHSEICALNGNTDVRSWTKKCKGGEFARYVTLSRTAQTHCSLSPNTAS